MEPCLISNSCRCKSTSYTVLYPQKIDWSVFSAYEFSARRERKIQHYRIVRCNDCGLVRSDPVLSREYLGKMYRECKFLYHDESKLSAITYAGLIKRFSRYFAGFPDISVLEVGCGNGTFLQELQNLNIVKLTGLEPSTEAINHAGEDIKARIINDVFRPGNFATDSFDIICAFHILDHLSDPDEFVKDCHRILKKGALLLLVCHDVDSLPNRLLREHSPVFDIEHIFLFNKKTLKRLTESAGFRVLQAGDLTNTYKISYWLKYLPLLNKLVKFLPDFVNECKISLQAGNIFICAQKK